MLRQVKCAKEGAARTVKASNFFRAVASEAKYRSANYLDLLPCFMFHFFQEILATQRGWGKGFALSILWFLHRDFLCETNEMKEVIS
jgi:hypothetical protein